MEREPGQRLVDLVKEFTFAVNSLENEIFERSSKEDMETLMEEFNARYQPLFAKYCTAKKRVYGGSKQSFGSPPQYDGIENCLDSALNVISDRKAEVTLKCLSEVMGEVHYLFVMLRKQEIWKIDSYKKWSVWKEKWVNQIL